MDYDSRISSSLQKLNVPSWYNSSAKSYQRPRAEGARLAGGWSGLSSRSLNVNGSRLQVRSSCSASASGALTPTPDSNYLGGGGYYHLPYRSTVSASTSPCCYGGMSPNYSNRTPYTSSGAYLGWRKHSAPTGSYKSPAERLAEGLRASRTSIESTESNVSNMSSTGSVGSRAMRVRHSIKQVSHAIVNYVNESNSNKLMWLESSFVGSGPVKSPGSSPEEFKLSNGWPGKEKKTEEVVTEAAPASKEVKEKPPPVSDSPTLEDILDSLLALRRSRKTTEEPRTEAPAVDSLAQSPTLATNPPPKAATSNDQVDQRTSAVGTTNETSHPGSSEPAEVRPPSHRSSISSSPPVTPPVSFGSPARKKHGRSSRPRSPPPPKPTAGAPRMDSPTFTELFNQPLHDSVLSNQEDISGEVQPHSDITADTFLKQLEESISATRAAPARRVSFDLADEGQGSTGSGGSRGGRGEEAPRPSCRNPRCAQQSSTTASPKEFKTCHNCNAYYCSRECRRLHWDKHKRLCMQSRVGALCKQIIGKLKEDQQVIGRLATIGKDGYSEQGRGAVKLFFSSPERVERYLSGGGELPEAWFLPLPTLQSSTEPSPPPADLLPLVREYNPDSRFILYVSICVVNEVPTSGAVRWEREMVGRVARCRLGQ